ncbi:MAG: hypothetical protein IKH76_00845, partial [Clostridiales bacterium]|nr:hypothetical protein [Clostridiales bacterium]
ESYFLNINIPALSKKEIKGVKICDRIGRIDYDENYFLTEEETGYYLNLGNSDVTSLFDERDERIDSNALKAGYITISPLFNNEINPQAVNEMCKDWSALL